MRVLVTGSRGWVKVGLLRATLDALLKEHPNMTVLQGGAYGVDTMAATWANARGVPCDTMKADWRKYGKAAGPIRNNAMLDTVPDLVVAFHDGKSAGTAHCIKQARDRRIPVKVYGE